MGAAKALKLTLINMSIKQKSDLLPSAVSRVVGDVLNPAGKYLLEPDLQQSQVLIGAPVANESWAIACCLSQ